MFDLNNFVIDRVIRGVMQSNSTNEVLWSINQIEDPSLQISSETADAVDAIGTPIMTFDRAKSGEFSGSNSLFDLGLLAAQMGTKKVVAGGTSKIKMPIMEEIDVPADATSITLAKTPAGTGAAAIPYIYKLSGDDMLAQKFVYGTEATADTFTFAGKELELPTGIVGGDTIFVVYEYEADGTEGNGGVSVEGDAINFPKAGKFIMEVLGCDVCEPEKLYYAYVIFPNAKLTSDFDLNFTTDGKHPFTLRLMQKYCDRAKKLFQIAIPEL